MLVIIWSDLRSGLYTQKISVNGQQSWDSTDIAVSLPPLSYIETISDGNGGFIIIGSGNMFSIRAQQVSRNGKLGEVILGVYDIREQQPASFLLYQNFPNPFNPVTNLQFDLPEQSVVTLQVFNMLGQLVEHILNNEELAAGRYTLPFDASALPSGTYIYRLTTTNRYSNVKKMLLLK